ncbi:MAG: FAD-dependent oxidoreductase [Bacteroidetes bacterium]|nr:FAD-dependent oxidoreductase [Bacteroidota bacterium]
MRKKIVVIGGGIAGMEASAFLSALRFDVTLIERKSRLGGHLLNWERLFPTMRHGSEVLNFLEQGIRENVHVLCNIEITQIIRHGNEFSVILTNGKILEAHAILVTTGYDLFDARKKEEYGYGIYENVITSADLETLFTQVGDIRMADGRIPKRIGMIHCVGSRDEKTGNTYCSKVCCVTAVKQAIEIRQRLPETEVFCFYMDLRMFGMHFEAMYKEAQEKYGVIFIRGRLSEACENQDQTIVAKVEDTLAGLPLKMNLDLLVLMVGFVPSEGTKKIGNMLGLQFGPNRFYKTRDQHTLTNVSNVAGVFFAGACTAPKTITHTITDARAAAATVASYLFEHPLGRRE